LGYPFAISTTASQRRASCKQQQDAGWLRHGQKWSGWKSSRSIGDSAEGLTCDPAPGCDGLERSGIIGIRNSLPVIEQEIAKIYAESLPWRDAG